MRKISIIVAMATNRVIGIKNNLPWHISDDLKRFKQLTTGHTIIMGRKTYESIGKALPNRTNIVVSRQKNLHYPDVIVCDSIQDAIIQVDDKHDIFIIGGAQIYEQALPFANFMYVTHVDSEIQGDVFFPEYNEKQWKIISTESRQTEGGLRYRFVDYELSR